MNPRLRALIALVALSSPAAAQPTTRDHRTPPPPGRPSQDVAVQLEVTSWSPKVGAPGSVVTIEGRAFGRRTQVLIGGQPVAARVSAERIVFRIPAVHGDGEVRLRKPGVADDYVVGNLTVEMPAAIRAVSPGSGAAGTRVEILGRGFVRGDEIRMNGRAIVPGEVQGDRLVFAVPDWGRTDYLVVSRAGLEKARSRRPFRVLAPPPIIVSFSPTSGPPESIARLSGTNFDPGDVIRYGNQGMKPLGRGNGWVDVRLPRYASESHPFEITGSGGEASSATPFRIELPGTISDVRPRSGVPGSQFSIVGRGFQAGDQVFLGGKLADVVRLAPGEVVAAVPFGTAGGDVVVRRGGAEYRARRPFQVLNPPTLTGFVPTRGAVGTRVILSGTWLTGAAEVWYGNLRVHPVRTADKSIEVVVPSGVVDARFRVKTGAGEVTSERAFQVLAYGAIEDARPRRVAAGAELRLSGTNLEEIDKLLLNDVELPIKMREGRVATATVPPGARDGRLAWMSNGRRSETSWTVQVLQPPSIVGFQPDDGPPRTLVIVKGRAFDEATRVFFGELPMRVIDRKGPFELTAEIPRDARGRDYLWVQGDGARVRSSEQYAVRVAPTVQEVSPRHARAGARLIVRGIGFDDSTEILVGPWRTTVRKRDGNLLHVDLAGNVAPGEFEIKAKNGALVSTWQTRFVVDPGPGQPDDQPLGPVAAITGFSPRVVEHGGAVEIVGTGLGSSTRILADGRELPVTRRDPSGTRLWVIVPNTVVGDHWLELIDGKQRARSTERLAIVEERGTYQTRDGDGEAGKGKGHGKGQGHPGHGKVQDRGQRGD